MILADNRIPEAAKEKLEEKGQVFYLHTRGITYPAISGHPDIFFCQTKDYLVYAPNAPAKLIFRLKESGIPLKKAEHHIGEKYPETASLNAVITEKYLIHNQHYTDPVIKDLCRHLEPIHLNQAYTRCSLIPLKEERLITSDRGIEKALQKRSLEVLFVDPAEVQLPGFDHGFIGGCCGIAGDDIYFIGSLDRIRKGNEIRDYLKDHEVIELLDEPLFDGGTIIFTKGSLAMNSQINTK
jgi:hypothetical protein